MYAVKHESAHCNWLRRYSISRKRCALSTILVRAIEIGSWGGDQYERVMRKTTIFTWAYAVEVQIVFPMPGGMEKFDGLIAVAWI